MPPKKKPDTYGVSGHRTVMRDEHFEMAGGGYGSRGPGTSRSAMSGFMKNFMNQFSAPPRPAPRNKQGGLFPSSSARYHRSSETRYAPASLSRQQRRAVNRLAYGTTHPKVLKEAQGSGAKASENSKFANSPHHPYSHAGGHDYFQKEMAREGAVYKHIVRGASQRRLDQPRPKLSLDPPSTIVNIDRGTIASRRGGEFARRRHEAETTHNSNMAIQAADYALARSGRSRQYLGIEDTIAGKTKRYPHNQTMSISGGTLPNPHTERFAQNYAISKAVSRHMERIPNTPPMVRTPYGSNRVGGRGIPRDLGPAIKKIGENSPPGLMLAIGISGAAEALKESRKRGISFGRYASSAASSLPPYGGRR